MTHRKLFICAGLVAALPAATVAALPAAAAAGSPAPRHTPPSVISAHRLAPDTGLFLAPGTRVSQSALGIRTFANRRVGFALAGVNGAGGGATYPARTVDGGRTWRIDGPHFHVNAADAPDSVTGSGLGGPRLFFAFPGQGGGQSVNVTTDAGAHWWRAYLPAPAEAIAVDRSGTRTRLVAFLQTSPVRVYVSRDGGRHWRPGHA